MYPGGNGFYWRITYHCTIPHTIEMRRGMTGLHTSEGEAGETALAFTGEPSSTWRSRAPNLKWLIDGIDLDKPFGDFSLRVNGAAGVEVDRFEPTLGTPPEAVWLATADRPG
jgi:N,N-dimethylformamidase